MFFYFSLICVRSVLPLFKLFRIMRVYRGACLHRPRLGRCHIISKPLKRPHECTLVKTGSTRPPKLRGSLRAPEIFSSHCRITSEEEDTRFLCLDRDRDVPRSVAKSIEYLNPFYHAIISLNEPCFKSNIEARTEVCYLKWLRHKCLLELIPMNYPSCILE